MATGWLRGVVKEVPSGDTLVVSGTAKPGQIPPEKRITLSSLVAPKLGRRDGTTKDEPFAWQSREFLRQKCIGQSCVFKIDYVVEQIGNREFGSVFLGQQENVALAVVSNGWAKVRAVGTQQSPYIEDLKKAEEQAQAAGLGLWTKDPTALAEAVREPPQPEGGFNALNFLQQVGKGNPLPGVVDQVLNGSTLRITLLPDFQSVTVAVCGIQAPSMGRRVAEPTGEGAAAPTAAEALAASTSTPSEPFAREAKYFTETKTLNREVRVVVEGVDKYNNLFGTILYPEGSEPANLADRLVQEGLAKCVEWSLNMMTQGSNRLRELERTAKQIKKAIWHNYVPQPTNQTKLNNNFSGKVVEVVSGDCLVIKDDNTGAERRVNLSSIRAPRGATRERPADPYGAEAKEFLRKKLIGKAVNVQMEYTRKVQPLTSVDMAAEGTREMAFGNVELASDKLDEEDKNVSEMVVARGFANVIRHRSDEERSAVYEKLLELEELAKQARRGLYSNKEPPPSRSNDVSLPGNAQRAKQYLPFLQRAGKMQAVVEYVLSGHRLKLHIPKEGVSIAFAPSGIKSPSRAQPAQGGRPAVVGEPYADESLAFTREHCMQRDVEVEVETMDRGGTFLGTLLIPGSKTPNYSVTLLRAGLAKRTFAADRVPNAMELEQAEAAAKQAKLKVWENWSPEDDEVEGGEEPYPALANGASAPSSSGSQGGKEKIEVTVTEVTDGGELFVQNLAEPRLQWIEEQLKNLNLGDSATGAFRSDLTVGTLCMAKFTLDNQWYRAYIERIHPAEPRYEVFFMDYGNKEKVSSDRVRAMEPSLAAVPPQAQLCQLAYVKVPNIDQEYGAEATAHLSNMLGGGQKFTATVESRERPVVKEKHPRKSRGKLYVTLTAPNSDVTINQQMLLAGMARLPTLRKVRDPAVKAAIIKLQEFEDDARKHHVGMFQYGDPGDSEEEEEARRPAPAPSKKK